MFSIGRLFQKPPVEKLMAKVNNIPHINKGGCAIVAHAGYQYARKQGKGAKILFGFRNSKEEIPLLKAGVPVTCGHAVLQVEDKFMDSTSIWGSFEELQKSYYGYEFHEVDPDLCYEAIQDPQGNYDWHYLFNRKKYAPKIARIFQATHEY